MSKWLKEQVIYNQHLSPRRWRIAVFELPNEIECENSIEDIYVRAMASSY